MFDKSAAKIFRTGGREGGYWCCLSGICWDAMLFYNHKLCFLSGKRRGIHLIAPSLPPPPPSKPHLALDRK